jgi:predicted phage tail protein
MLRKVKLYGHLAKEFGKEHMFEVKNVTEAISALKSNFKKFAGYVNSNSEPGYHVFTDHGDTSVDEMGYPSKGTIKIVPYIKGAGGIFKIITGIALIAASFIPGLNLFAASFLLATGTSMLLGGVSELLSPTPKTREPLDKEEEKPNTSFSGVINTAAQGNAIPVLYGKLRVGSLVVSTGLTSSAAPEPVVVSNLNYSYIWGGLAKGTNIF